MKSTKSGTKGRVVLVGNGPNLLPEGREDSCSWDTMIREMEGAITEDAPEFPTTGKNLPHIFRMQRAENHYAAVYGDEGHEKRLSGWLDRLKNLTPCGIHRLLASYPDFFSAVLTTNYDYVIEKALGIPVATAAGTEETNLYRCRTAEGKPAVYHIHGELGAPKSLLTGVDSYMRELSQLVAHWERTDKKEYSWLEHFIYSELHICGIGFGYEELTLWYALQKRLEVRGPGVRDAFVYLFYTPKDRKKVDEQAALFISYGVLPRLIRVVDDDYVQAWEHVVASMLENSANCPRLDKVPSATRKSAQAPASLADGETPFLRCWPGCNVSVASSLADLNVDRCHMQIAAEKLGDKVFDDGKWFFDIVIKSRRYTYQVDVVQLREKLHNEQQDAPDDGMFSFYIDYRTGRLYTNSLSPLAESFLQAECLVPAVFAPQVRRRPRKP